MAEQWITHTGTYVSKYIYIDTSKQLISNYVQH